MVSVANIGETAHAILQCETTGVVEATFERCAYINFSDQYLCIALASIGRGPLNIVYEQGVQRLPEHLLPGVVVACSPVNKSLEIPTQGNQLIAQFARAVVCDNNVTGGTECVHAASINRQQLHKLARPSTGLFGALVSNGSEPRPARTD